MERTAMRQALVRIGFSNEAAMDITNVQGIDDANKLIILSDTGIESLCRIVRKPGGQITVNEEGDMAPNPGKAVSLRAENNLKLARYYLRHQKRISEWPVPLADITLDNVRSLKGLRDIEVNYELPDDKAPSINNRNWPKTLEAITKYLKSIQGIKGTPLAYVIRTEREVANDDPEWTHNERMIMRAPHFKIENPTKETDVFKMDNESVWKEISDITREHKCWTYVKPFQRKHDGRGAYRALWDHYLGPSNVDHLAAAAELKLETAKYTGKKKRYNFESYVRLHKDQHQILSDLTQHGYSGIDERSKVRHLMAGIRVSALDTVKSRILSDAKLCSNFDQSVTLYQDFIKQMKVTEPIMNISKVQIDSKKRGTKEVQDRYYTPQEYAKLTKDQKMKLKGLRDARGSKRAKTDSSTSQLDDLKKQIASLQSKLDATDDTATTCSGSILTKTGGSNAGSKAGSNLDHPALKRTRQAVQFD